MVGTRTYISSKDRDRIHAAVTAAERRTGAEFVLVVADASDGYALFPLVWAGAVSLVAAGILVLAAPPIGARLAFLAQAGCFLLLGTLFHWTPVRLLLVPAGLKRREAGKLARLEFAQLVLGRTRGRTGILLFASLAERYVEILVDQAISKEIPDTVWRTIVDEFVGRLKVGQAVDGFLGAVEACTGVLERKFPRRPDDRDEISDALVVIE